MSIEVKIEKIFYLSPSWISEEEFTKLSHEELVELIKEDILSFIEEADLFSYDSFKFNLK